MENSNRIAKEFLLGSQVKGERIITIIRLILLIPLFLFIIIVFIKSSIENGFLSAIREPLYMIELGCLLVFLPYSFWLLGQLKKNKYFTVIKYLSPFIDITLLSIIVLMNAPSFRIALIMTGAPTFIYFVFLVLSVLRNSISSVIFTGGYITLIYSFFTYHAMSLLRIFDGNGKVFTNSFGKIVQLDWDDEMIKPLVFLIVTVLLAYLASRFNKMVVEQTRMSVDREQLKEVFINNVRQVSENLFASGKSLSSTYDDFSGRIDELVNQSRKIGNETNEEYKIIESTSKTITDIIGSIEAVTGHIKEQAFHVGETAAAIGEMESSIRTITDSSQKASDIAQSLFSAAKKGGEAVSDVYQAIIETERSSKQIEEIVELITGIASTTDLLSMNAAIEAAHAGDAGRGFTVVADEIRKLAETASINANQISNILKEIIGKIKNIEELAQEANRKLDSIFNDAGETSKINSIVQNAMEEELKTVNDLLKTLISLKSITEEVKNVSVEQSEGSKVLLVSVERLKKQADNISVHIDSQLSGCGIINELVNNFNSVVKNNNTVIDQLEELINKI
jgi:methyl-accepting chemotaxis protein